MLIPAIVDWLVSMMETLVVKRLILLHPLDVGRKLNITARKVVKSVLNTEIFWSAFPDSVQMRQNMDQKNSVFGQVLLSEYIRHSEYVQDVFWTSFVY